MEFLKKNYEKIVLSLVLAGLLGLLVFLPFYISADKQKIADLIETYVNPRVSALTNLDLSTQQFVVKRLKTPLNLDLETGNKLFNPLVWQKTLDGRMFPITTGNEIGPRAAAVTSIVPLCYLVTLDAVVTNELGARYTIGVERQAAELKKRKKTQRYVSAGEKPNDLFAVVEVKGAPDNPEAIVLKLGDTGELATLSQSKPFRRVDAYAADFKYDLDKKVFRDCRINTKVSFGGTEYVVADVNQKELILVDQSNQKKSALPFTP